MKKHIPRTLNYGCLVFSAIGTLPSFVLIYGLLIIAQRNALTPKHFVLLIYCFLSVVFVGALTITMRKGKRWSMLSTALLLILSLFSELFQVYKNQATSHSSPLPILLFCLPIHLLALALLFAPSTQQFFTQNTQSKKLNFFLKNLGLLSLPAPDDV